MVPCQQDLHLTAPRTWIQLEQLSAQKPNCECLIRATQFNQQAKRGGGEIEKRQVGRGGKAPGVHEGSYGLFQKIVYTELTELF